MIPETAGKLLEPFWEADDGRSPSQRAEAYGIDLSLITENLLLSPEERINRNQAALDFAGALQEALRRDE